VALALIAFAALRTHATTFRVFGSAGAESALTPPNYGSPLNPNNVAAIQAQQRFIPPDKD